MLRKSLTLLTLIVVFLLAATGMASADQSRAINPGADPNPRPSPSPSPSPSPRPVLVTVTGVVQTVAEESFVMLDGGGREINVAVTSDTRFVISGDTDPELADLASGDQAVVIGWPDPEDPDAITARLVTVRKVQPQPVRVSGLVTEVDVTDSWFQMALGDATRAREIKVWVVETTEFVMPGVAEPGLAKLLVGDKVVVVSEPVLTAAEASGTRPEPTEITAKTVYVQRVQARPVQLLGQVAEMDYDEGTFDLVLADGVVKHIATTDETGYGVPGVEDATLADVKDGDIAQVMARPPDATATTAEEWYTALSVVVQKPRPVTLIGEIGQVDEVAGTFELKLEGGAVKEVKTNADTRYKVPGVEEPTIADLEPGQRAVVTALAVPVVTSTSALADVQLYELLAKLVVVQSPRPANLTGTIEAVDAANQLFVLKTHNGETKRVRVNEGTNLVIPGVEEPALADLENQIGAMAVVKGILLADGTILAQAVAVRPQVPRRGAVVGEVTAIAEAMGIMDLTVQTSAGEQHVLVTEETQVRPPEAQLEVGSRISAAGVWMVDGSLKALTIAVRPALPTPEPPAGPTA